MHARGKGSAPRRRIKPGMRVASRPAPIPIAIQPRPIRRGNTAVAEDRKEPPFDGGSQPVPHQTDPVPGPGRGAAQWLTILLCVLVVAAVAVYVFGR